MQKFSNKQMNFIKEGALRQKVLENYINDAFNNNMFNDNFIISSLPGLGKTFTTAQELKKHSDDEFILIEGNSSLPGFIIDVTTAVYLATLGKKQLTIILDDCDVLFADANINTAKKMFDDTRALKYNKPASALKSFCTDLQKEAVEYFSKEESSGFSVPLDAVTFIVLSNRLLPTSNQVDGLEEGTKKHSVQTDLLAIRRRTQYKQIDMDLDVLWGYVANVTLNTNICEKATQFMKKFTDAELEQIVDWLDKRWDKVSERNLSIVEKMAKDMVRYPNEYVDIWEINYV